jgi:uncharacterized protein YbjQ (UPF0145 family)
MIHLSAPAIEAKAMRRYHGVVTREAISGAGSFRGFFACIRD